MKLNGSLHILGDLKVDEYVWQLPIDTIVSDAATVAPGVGLPAAAAGQRYAIQVAGTPHPSWGTFKNRSGLTVTLENGDLVEFDGSFWILIYDASVLGKGVVVYDKSDNLLKLMTGSSWSIPAPTAAGDGIILAGGEYDIDLATTSGLELTSHDGSGQLRLSAQGNGIAGGAGTLLSVDPATPVSGTRAAVYVGVDGVGIDLDNATLTHSSSVLQIKDSGIVEAKIALGAVTTNKLADASVTSDKIAASIAGNGLSGGAGSPLSVNVDNDSLEIVSDTLQVKTLGITSSKLAPNIDATKIADGSVSNAEFQRLDGVTSPIQTQLDSKIPLSEKGAANGVASLDSSGKVPVTQLPSAIMEYQGVWDASTNTPTLADGGSNPNEAIGNVYRVSVAGTQDLGSGPITFAVGDYAILNSSKVWEKADTTDAVSSVNGQTGTVTVNAIYELTGDVTAGPATESQSKVATIAAGAVTLSKLAANSVDASKIVDGSVGTAELADGAVTLVKLAADSVDASKIVDGSVGTAELANSAVTLAKLATDSVDASKIVDGSVGTDELANSSVTLAKLASNSVDASKIVDGSVGTDELANSAVTLAKLAADSVDASKIVDGSVGTDELANSAVTSAKLATNAVGAAALNEADAKLRSQSFTMTGDGSKTSFTCTHSWGTRLVAVEIVDDLYNTVIPNSVARTTTTVVVTFEEPVPDTLVYRALLKEIGTEAEGAAT